MPWILSKIIYSEVVAEDDIIFDKIQGRVKVFVKVFWNTFVYSWSQPIYQK